MRKIKKILKSRIEENKAKSLIRILNEMLLDYELEDLLFFDEIFNTGILELNSIERKSFFKQLEKRVEKRQEDFKNM